MSEHRSLYRKVIYLVVIAVLSIPVYGWAIRPRSMRMESHGGRKVGAIARDKISPGDAGRNRSYQPNHATRHAGPARRGGADSLGTGARSIKRTKIGTAWRRCRTNHPAAAEFLVGVGFSRAQSVVQHFGGVRRLPRSILLGDEGHRISQAGDWNINATDPRFLARIGWFYGNKIGKADEHKEYRELFRKQQEEQGEKLTDNWLVSNDWYRKAQNLVDNAGSACAFTSAESKKPNATSRANGRPAAVVLFRSRHGADEYAETLEDEGTFGDTAKDAWENAAAEWEKYRNRDISTSYSYFVRLVDLEVFRQQLADNQKNSRFVPGEMEKAKQEVA